MRNRSVKTIVAGAFFAAALACNAQVLEIRGSTVVEKDVLLPAAAAIKSATGVEIKVLGMGSGRGMTALFEGKTSVAAISETLEEAVASAKKSAAETGSSVTVPANLMFHELGKDRVAVFLHKDNPVNSLTKAQLKDIFSGKATNWKQVGGADLPIKIFMSSPGSGTRAVFQKLALDGAEYGSGIAEFRTSLAAIVEVGKQPAGIGVAGPTLLDDAKSPNLKIINTPSVERPLALVTVGQPSDSARKVIDHLRKNSK